MKINGQNAITQLITSKKYKGGRDKWEKDSLLTFGKLAFVSLRNENFDFHTRIFQD